MQVLRYFFHSSSHSKTPGNIGLVNDLSTPWHRLSCCELPRPRTICPCRHVQILAGMLLHQLAPYLWCPVLVVTFEKHCGFSTSLKISFYKPAGLLDATYKKNQRDEPRVFGFACFWYSCCLIKFCRPDHNF